MNIEERVKFETKLSIMARYLPSYEAEDFETIETLLGIDPEFMELVETSFLPTIDNRGEFYLAKLAQIAIRYNYPRLAKSLFLYCIDHEVLATNEDVISTLTNELLRIIAEFRFDSLIDIERQSERLRLQTPQKSIGIPASVLSPELRIRLFEVVHTRLLKSLTYAGHNLPLPHDIVIEKYSNLVNLIRLVGKETPHLLLNTRWAKLYAYESLSFSQENSASLFSQKHPNSSFEYDEMLCRNFRVLLFPSIGEATGTEDSIIIINEGMGSIQDPVLAVYQNNETLLEVPIVGSIEAGFPIVFRLGTMEKRRLLTVDPNHKQAVLKLRFHKFGTSFEINRTIQTDVLTRDLSNNARLEILKIKDADDLYGLVISFFADRIRHRVEQDDGYVSLTSKSSNGRELRSEKEIQITLKHWLEDLCQPYGIDINREALTGRGPTDFKFSIGSSIKCIAEVKLWGNQKLEHGVLIQLPIYLTAENALHGIYVPIAIDKDSYDSVLPKLKESVNDINSNSDFKIALVEICAWKRQSASKAKTYDDPARYSM